MLALWKKILAMLDARPSKIIDLEIFCDASGAWRWRMRARNNEILAVSEAYSSKAKAQQTAKLVQSSDFAVVLIEK